MTIGAKPGERRTCRWCQLPIGWPQSGAGGEYAPRKHGPVEAAGFWIDIDGTGGVHGFTSGGHLLKGELVGPEVARSRQAKGGRIFKVYRRHWCPGGGTGAVDG